MPDTLPASNPACLEPGPVYLQQPCAVRLLAPLATEPFTQPLAVLLSCLLLKPLLLSCLLLKPLLLKLLLLKPLLLAAAVLLTRVTQQVAIRNLTHPSVLILI